MALIHSAAADRNRLPILQQLQRILPATGSVLEIASGTGQHAAFFAAHFPGLRWQPSEANAEMFASIRGYSQAPDLVPAGLEPAGEDSAAATRPGAASAEVAGDQAALTNVAEPIFLDVLDEWPSDPVDAVITANLLHISLPEVLPALCQGAANVLRPGGWLFIYGPFKRHGAHTSESNRRFDASLKEQQPAWGIRDLEKVIDVATANGFQLHEVVAMPANNFSIVLQLTI